MAFLILYAVEIAFLDKMFTLFQYWQWHLPKKVFILENLFVNFEIKLQFRELSSGVYRLQSESGLFTENNSD